MSIKKNKNQLIISILVGLAIFAVSYQFVIKQYEENTRQKEEIKKLKSGIGVNTNIVQENTTVYVVAKKDIEKGAKIQSTDIELKDLGIKMSNVFTDESVVIGKKALDNIKEGHPLIKNKIENLNETALDEPRPGYRAVTASISSNRMAPFIKNGAFIDLYTVGDTIQAKNIRIIKILNPEGNANKLVLFEVREEDVGAFIYGTTKDKLIPVQKNKSDNSYYEFAYDPFKYSPYTISNQDLKELEDEPPKSTPDKSGSYIISNTAKQNENKETVEIIQGSVKKTIGF